MQKLDIRKIKNELRQSSKEYRKSLDEYEKSELDNSILENLFSIDEIKNAKTVLCYVSTPIEVDTHRLISKLIQDGKNVAVPRCVDGEINMNFYYISSLDDTERHTFGVYEPIIEKCEKLRDFRNSVCIIPGLLFDTEGYRLGYGRGYYDRFLSNFKGLKIGICYEKCIHEKLPHGFFDVAADIVVTNDRIINI